ncbi:NAD(+)--dinitrogen-reductase ADP-D-ribosyltransferase [Methylocaldum gracile]|jgi:NAD+--dinitrogen-reductase ADP-D-ribosyltransferase|uniref:NAD(+)--dinitrogen-reductase ADP-D-ribosyltransferase n=1 Tax=unclassified Methylocaldum TaxID=2622260 RepID=UPI00105B46E3
MAQDIARIGHSTNLVGIPTGLLASTAFNEHPLPLHISGVREANYGLFDRLREAEDAQTAAEIFQEYMYVLFGLNGEPPAGQDGTGPRRFRSSYLKLLSGWGFDSNNPQGAVLKGWVESRFGLFPTFHKEPLTRFTSPAWIAYIEEKMSSRFHNNSINLQLDLMYEFCQWAIARFGLWGRRHVTLYRGENHFDEQRQIGPREGRWLNVRLNNLVSFTANRETACEFGDFILEVQVPVVKIFFFNNLLPRHPLKGEWEYLVIGGEYRVKASYY